MARPGIEPGTPRFSVVWMQALFSKDFQAKRPSRPSQPGHSKSRVCGLLGCIWARKSRFGPKRTSALYSEPPACRRTLRRQPPAAQSPIWRSASVAASSNHAASLRGGSSVALRMASRVVEASDQSPLPFRRASQNPLHELPCRMPRTCWRTTSTGPRGVITVTVSERLRTALPAAICRGASCSSRSLTSTPLGRKRVLSGLRSVVGRVAGWMVVLGSGDVDRPAGVEDPTGTSRSAAAAAKRLAASGMGW